MKNKNNEKTLANLFEEVLMKSLNLSKEQAQKYMAEIEEKATDLVNLDDPEINRRLEVFGDLTQEEISEDIGSFLQDLKANSHSEEEQVRLTNEIFNQFGFSLEKGRNNNFELKLVEPQL